METIEIINATLTSGNDVIGTETSEISADELENYLQGAPCLEIHGSAEFTHNEETYTLDFEVIPSYTSCGVVRPFAVGDFAVEVKVYNYWDEDAEVEVRIWFKEEDYVGCVKDADVIIGNDEANIVIW